MTESRGFSYAVVLAAAFALWIPVALFGAGGYSVLLALAAIPAAFFVSWRGGISRLAIAVLLLVAWSAISSLWSDETGQIMSGDLAQGDFGINAAGLRILLTAIAGILTIAACLRIRSQARIAAGFIVLVILTHGILMLLMGLLPNTALSAYAPFSDPVKEAPQNILRSANAFFLGVPLLIGAAWCFPAPWRYPAAAAGFLLSAATFLLLRSDVALLGMVFVALASAVVMIFRKNGFRILIGFVALAVVSSPIVLGATAPMVVNSDLPLQASSKSRIFAWSLAARKVEERPLVGHGIEASKEWRETFAEEPDLLELMRESTDLTGIPWEKYRILPGHPHNMGLQLWAETGLVGVLLGCAALFLLALALPSPATLGTPLALATAGLIGASFSLFSLSYSVWNEAFWANMVLSAAAIIVLGKARPRRESAE
ncbi:MAG: O-antigen ligase family protein [Henriciella sp.]|uniref:O-antigen ligase family protein n=1 Tax=Henriciella sp. TaxID=1968823 RepID=UPI0032EF595C